MSLARSNLRPSCSSLAKALATRTPEMLLSMAAVISAVLRLTSMLARFMRRRWLSVNQRQTGSATVSTSASSQRSRNITISAPMMVSVQMMTFSGPWWLSSVMSNSSLVMRLISTPVRFWS